MADGSVKNVAMSVDMNATMSVVTSVAMNAGTITIAITAANRLQVDVDPR
jgi:hypothetical protein